MKKFNLKTKKYYIAIFLTILVACSFSKKEDGSEASFTFINNISEVSIPIKYEPNRIYIPVILEDSVFCDLLLDTGAKDIVFDSVFIAENKEKLGMLIYPHSPIRVYTPDGLKLHYQTIFVWKNNAPKRRDSLKLQIGNSIFFHTHPVVYNGKNRETGIFPMQILGKEKIVNINVEDKYIALLDTLNNKADSISFTVNPSTSAPMVKIPIIINTPDTCYRINGNFLLDLGFSGELLFPESILKKELMNIPYKEYHYLSSTVKGTSSMKETDQVSISLGLNNLTVHNALIAFSPSLPPDMTGIIGMGFLEHLNFAVDYKNLLFHYHIKDSVITKKIIDSNDKFGVFIRKQNVSTDEFLYIEGLEKRGRADSLGITIGDHVIKVGDIEVNGANYEALYDSLPHIRKLTIKKTDGSIIQLDK
jgi:predicted aspartyl protease